MNDLSWKAKAVLKLIREFRATPGTNVPFKSLWQLWGQNHAAAGNEPLWEGLDELATAALIEPFTKDDTGVTLTEPGYEADFW